MIASNHQYIDLQSLKENTFDDASIMQEIMTLFIELIDEYVIILNTELPNKNWEGLFKATHKIKPNISMFGISQLEPTILQLENNFRKEEHLDTINNLIEYTLTVFKDVKKEIITELKSMNNEHKENRFS
ncbi:MAG: Hpt domain-containing protein [Algibacter sp.]